MPIIIPDPSVNDEVLVFDANASGPNGENPGDPLSVGPGTNYPLVEAAFPAPPQSVLYASSIDTEGETRVTDRYGNRTITLTLRAFTTATLDALEVKFAKLQREGGTLHRTRIDGSVRIYDIVAGDGWDPALNRRYYKTGGFTQVALSLPARPLARVAEVEI